MAHKAIGDGSVIDIGVEIDPRDADLQRLEGEVRQLRRALKDAEVEAERAREDANRALSMLRRQLNPLYRALQAVFGELDAAGVGDSPLSDESSPPREGGAPSQDPRVSTVWTAWKERFGVGSGPARVIDALLLHGDLNVAQLKVAGQMATQTVYDSVSKLNKLGLIDKNGGRYSLKKL